MQSENTQSTRTDRENAASAPYLTDHLALASYLLLQGLQATLSCLTSERVLFAFEPSSQLSDHIRTFYSGEARVEPNEYDAARLRLRREMQELKEGRK